MSNKWYVAPHRTSIDLALLKKEIEPDPKLAELYAMTPETEPISAKVLVDRSGFKAREAWLLLGQLVCGGELRMWHDSYGDYWVARARDGDPPPATRRIP